MAPSPQSADAVTANGHGYNSSVEDFRDIEYPMLKGSVYLDHAGTTPYAKSLMDRFARDMTANLFGNPHSASSSSQLSTSRIDDIRLGVLRFFNADPADFDVVFVPNATAGIKLVAEALRAAPGGFDYAYHQASHTSLVGVREEARNSCCLDDQQVERWLDGGLCPFGRQLGEDHALLFAYPAQSNMDGRRYPLGWAGKLRQRDKVGTASMYTLLDAAAFVSSSPLDLGCFETAPDFTVLSFYKIFGFPDLGALIVRRGAEQAFNSRRYFGGGTVDMVVCWKEQWHAPKSQFLHERLEDGTLPIHNIIALDAAMHTHRQLFGSMERVAAHTAFLAQRLYGELQDLRHGNGRPVCTIYSPNPISSHGSGPVVAFNIRNSLGAWISLAEIEKLATLKRFHLRTGGVCNPGGIASALRLEPWEMKQNFSSGFRCGTDNDIMAGKPTGVIRVSLGAMSTMADVEAFVSFIAEFYCDSFAIPVSIPPRIQQTKGHPRLYVHSMAIYPIKSCGRFEIPPNMDWEIRPEGLVWDREWCLVHQGTGQALSQKRFTKMALIRPILDFERGQLRITYAGPVPHHLPAEVTVPLSHNPALFDPAGLSRSRPSRVCGDEIQAQAYASSEINDFFSGVLGTPCLLARFPPGGQGKSMRHAKAHLQKHQTVKLPATLLPANTFSVPGSFPAPPSPPDSDSDTDRPARQVERRILLSNESPILAMSLESLNALNCEIKQAGGCAVSADVFRANVIVGQRRGNDGGGDDDDDVPLPPYAEDDWTTMLIGDNAHEFEMLGSCRRCHMVCVNQETGEKGEEPFVTLARTRRFDGKVFFGVHMCYKGRAGEEATGPDTLEGQWPRIRVGDVVHPG